MTLPDEQPDGTLAAVDNSRLDELGRLDIDDVLAYVHADLKRLPDFTALYRRYLRQRWDVYDIDFSADATDWHEKMTDQERDSFLSIASGFHHGERQVEIELPVFMLGGEEDQKVFIASQIEDEARHTIFFDRFYREVVGVEGDSLFDVLDASFPYITETFVGPFGLLAYQADELRLRPNDEAARVRYATNYFLWIEGVLALSVMKITLSFCRQRGLLPGYYTGFTATCRDEARHVQGGMRYLQDSIRRDPTLLTEVHETLRTILALGSAVSRPIIYEPLGWTREEVQRLMRTQLRRKLSDVGIDVPPDIEAKIADIRPVAAGG